MDLWIMPLVMDVAEVDDDHWMGNFMIHVKEEEEEEGRWMVQLLT